jgi:hypothetical protein
LLLKLLSLLIIYNPFLGLELCHSKIVEHN